MDWTRLQNKIETKIYIFILEIFKIRRSPDAHFSFTNLRINTDVLSPMRMGQILPAAYLCEPLMCITSCRICNVELT